MRPVYENATTLEAEGNLADLLSQKWHLDFVKLPAFYDVDYAAMRENRVEFWVELKCRTNPSTQYRSYMISARKWFKMIDLAFHTRLAVVLFVSFADRVMYCPVHRSVPVYYTVGGRTDRKDEQDRELVVHIPMKRFSERTDIS